PLVIHASMVSLTVSSTSFLPVHVSIYSFFWPTFLAALIIAVVSTIVNRLISTVAPTHYPLLPLRSCTGQPLFHRPGPDDALWFCPASLNPVSRTVRMSGRRNILTVQMKLLDCHGTAHFLFNLAQRSLGRVLNFRVF